MIIRILGSAAGGGFPQWNCLCPNCRSFRAGTLNAIGRTQSSIAISSDGDRWVIVNASPDIHRQLARLPAAPVESGSRTTPVAAVILVDGQIDHSAGLLLLRENRVPLEIWTSAAVREDLQTGLPILRVLESYCGVDWREILVDGSPFRLAALPGVSLRARCRFLVNQALIHCVASDPPSATISASRSPMTPAAGRCSTLQGSGR